MGFARAQVVWLMRANSRCKRVTIMTRDAQESRPMMSSGLGDYVRVCVRCACVCVWACGRARRRLGTRGCGDWVRVALVVLRGVCILWG